MAQFVEATDAETGGDKKIFINLDLVTRITRQDNNTTRVLFAAGVPERGDRFWVEATVRETPEDLLQAPRL